MALKTGGVRLDQAMCSIARTTAVVGDRWVPLILRDVYFGLDRFDQLQEDLRVASNVLSSRLDHLVDNEMLERVAYQEHPPRYCYRLTERATDFIPVLLSLMAWGDRWLAPEGPPVLLEHRDAEGEGHVLQPEVYCASCGERVTAEGLAAKPGPGMPDDEVRAHFAERFARARPPGGSPSA
ncbi:MAG: winged helix-turn-helix transcriptional regulator [Tepidiformaceae bacterium]